MMVDNAKIFFVFYILLCCYSESNPIEPQYKINIVDLATTTAKDSGSRIVGGQDTTIEKWPFIVQVDRFESPICAGSILTTRHVLSAAHCFVDSGGADLPANWHRIRAGTTTLRQGGTISNVQNLINHPSYNRITLRDYDVAVLLLETALEFGNAIRAASIPEFGNVVPDNSPTTYVGWGYTNPDFYSQSFILQEVDVYKVNRDLCQEGYLETERLYQAQGYAVSFPVTDTMICAGVYGVGGKDGCQGDSGGPLVYNGVVVGIISWGYGCANPITMGVNARVANFINWISESVQKLSGIETEEEKGEDESETDDGSDKPVVVDVLEEIGTIEENQGNGVSSRGINTILMIISIFIYITTSPT